MTDRLFVASEVTRRINYIQSDIRELARLLQGETLSPAFRESVLELSVELRRIAGTAMASEIAHADAA